jgi:hypothetical protein
VLLLDPPTEGLNIEVHQAVLALINYQTIHRRLIHASRDVVVRAYKKAGIQLQGAHDKHFCEQCVIGKATDILGKEAPIVTKEPLGYIRTDLIYHKSAGHLGYHYLVYMVDVYSGHH